jgi:CTP synthase
MSPSKKFVFITGGVCSSLGKGISSASIGLLLERQGLKVAMMKLDPYLNVDPGTMSPYQHGEVYVTDDGAETDLDLGHYYRYTHSPLSRISSVTSGQIYDAVIKRERRGDYLGKTVQVIPHITEEIKQRIYSCFDQEKGTQVAVIEVGGTVGDIESLPFLEALRQLKYDMREECITIHVTYVPYLEAAKEIKTKPTQHSVQMLRQIGLFPDFIICRSERPLSDELKEKISLFCNVPREGVLEALDVKETIYEVPLRFKEQSLDQLLVKKLSFPYKKTALKDWENLIKKESKAKKKVRIAFVGKYVSHQDAYKSILESLSHAAIQLGIDCEVHPFEADKVITEGHLDPQIHGFDGYLIPGGFGERGWLGKILTCRYAREKKIPYFGICLGMQVMVTEFARHVLKFEDANSTEIDPSTEHPVISLLEEQRDIRAIGGTMRLGAFSCLLKKGSHAEKAYKATTVSERHRHRFEFNNKFRDQLEEKGLVVTGMLKDGDLVEIVELKDHPWMVGVQFHPEFKSRPLEPHPLFLSFLHAASRR